MDDQNTIADIAWTGGMQVAYPLLNTAKRMGDGTIREIASAMNAKAMLLNEEFREGKWNVTGWWGAREDCFNFGDDPLHSASTV